MSRAPIIRLLRRPEWYSAMYSLAAHESHLALEPIDKDRHKEVLSRARGHALLLAWGCAAQIEWGTAADLKKLQRLEELDLKLFPGTELPSVATPPEAARVARLQVHERYSVRRSRKVPEARDPLGDFLKRTVEPSALLLLAGIDAECGAKLVCDQSEGLRRVVLLKKLEEAATGKTLQPDALVATALASKDLDSRARYNLACYYARTATEHPARLERARTTLTGVMLSTHGAEHRALSAWAWKDPGLRPAITDWKDAEEVLGPRPAAVAAAPADPPDLERIAAIGGYAAALADTGIHTPETLSRALRTPGSAKSLVEQLDIDQAMVRLWIDLLELMKIEGIGPAQLNLLEASGVTSLSRLVRETPERLHRRLVQVNRARQLVHAVPSLATLAEWQAQVSEA